MEIILKDETIGNLKYSGKVVLDDEALNRIAYEGTMRVLQGAKGAGAWEALAIESVFPGCKARKDIEAKVAEGKLPAFIDEKTGKERKFTRTDLPFSTTLADALKRTFEGIEVEIGEVDGKPITVPLGLTITEVEEYTGSTGSVPKYAAEKAFVKLYLTSNGGMLKDGVTPRSVETFCASRGLDTPTEPWEEDVTFLAAVKAWDAARKAAEAAGE